MTGLSIQQRRDGAVGLLALKGDMGVELIPELQRAAQGLLDGGAKHLVIDLQALDFMDSASLGALLSLAQGRAKAGERLVLCSLSASFLRLLDAAGLRGQLNVAADERAARALLAR